MKQIKLFEWHQKAGSALHSVDVLLSHENGSSFLVYKVKITPETTSEKGTEY